MRRVCEPLVLVGSGGLGRETAEVARAINDAHETYTGRPRWRLLGFVDDDPARWGTTVSGAPVLGGIEKLADLPTTAVVLCVGNPDDVASRKRIVRRLSLPRERYATLVHPAAMIPASCSVGEGSVVLAGAVATADVEIGAHVGVMPQAVLTHDTRLGDFVTVGAGARLAGGVEAGEGAYLGSGCLIAENRRVGPWALVGMGAVVTCDVPGGEVWAGVPARFVGAVESSEKELSA